jgi:hypothetical protein
MGCFPTRAGKLPYWPSQKLLAPTCEVSLPQPESFCFAARVEHRDAGDCGLRPAAHLQPPVLHFPTRATWQARYSLVAPLLASSPFFALVDSHGVCTVRISPQSPTMSAFRLLSISRKRRVRIEAEATHAAVLTMTRHVVAPRWGGSVPMHRVIWRDKDGAWAELVRRYFAPEPLFDDATFRRR